MRYWEQVHFRVSAHTASCPSQHVLHFMHRHLHILVKFSPQPYVLERARVDHLLVPAGVAARVCYSHVLNSSPGKILICAAITDFRLCCMHLLLFLHVSCHLHDTQGAIWQAGVRPSQVPWHTESERVSHDHVYHNQFIPGLHTFNSILKTSSAAQRNDIMPSLDSASLKGTD